LHRWIETANRLLAPIKDFDILGCVNFVSANAVVCAVHCGAFLSVVVAQMVAQTQGMAEKESQVVDK